MLYTFHVLGIQQGTCKKKRSAAQSRSATLQYIPNVFSTRSIKIEKGLVYIRAAASYRHCTKTESCVEGTCLGYRIFRVIDWLGSMNDLRLYVCIYAIMHVVNRLEMRVVVYGSLE